MGVNPWYIKGPVVLQGASYGAASAMVATAIIWGIHIYMDSYVTGQLASYMPLLAADIGYGMVPTFLVILALGVAVGAGGSYWTSGRYIRL